MVTKAERTWKLMRKHLRSHRGYTVINIPNVYLNFKAMHVFQKVLPSGNVKLGEIYHSGPDGIKFVNKIGKITKSPKTGRWELKLGRGTGTNILIL